MTAVPLGGAAAGLGSAAALTIERTTGGGVRITCDRAPGWAAMARTPVELHRAITEGWREADVAAYAQRAGETYDLLAHDRAAIDLSLQGAQLPSDVDERLAVIAETTTTAHAPGDESPRRADPLAWTPEADGRWRSPSGRLYGPQTQVVQRVIAHRAEMGVDTPPPSGASFLTRAVGI